MAMPPAAFGPGILIMTRTDISPGIAVNVGFVNEFQIDFSGNTKQLYGQNQYALVAARGTIKATGKMKAAVLSGLAMNNLFYGNSFSTANFSAGVGVMSWNVGIAQAASSGSTTVSPAGAATFDADLGVTYAASTIASSTVPPPAGLPLQRVSTGSEAAGKYSVTSTGGYNFSTADCYSTATGGTGPANFKITFTTDGSTTGSTLSQTSLTVTNQLIGFTPTFQLDYFTNLNQPGYAPFAVRIFSCVAAKHAMAFKLEDFLYPEFDFDIFANSAGQVFDIVTPFVA